MISNYTPKVTRTGKSFEKGLHVIRDRTPGDPFMGRISTRAVFQFLMDVGKTVCFILCWSISLVHQTPLNDTQSRQVSFNKNIETCDTKCSYQMSSKEPTETGKDTTAVAYIHRAKHFPPTAI